MGIESGPTPAEEILAAKAEEIEAMNNRFDHMEKNERSVKLNDIRKHLESLGMSTTNMDQRDLIERFVNEESPDLTNSN